MTVSLRLLASLGIITVLTAFSTRAAMAQNALTPRDIGQIADVLIERLLPAEQRLSRVAVSNRGIYFDRAKTLAAFGYGSNVERTAMSVKRPVTDASPELLIDCQRKPQDKNAFKACGRLGWGVYFTFAPVPSTGPALVVKALLLWPDRGPEPFSRTKTPGDKALLVGFAQEITLGRSGDGNWAIEKESPVMVF